MKGRKPKPIQRQMVEGDPAKRGVNTLDRKIAALPKAQRGIPDPPRHLQGLAREQWGIWKRDLELMQMDYSADAVMLEGACINYARAIEADETLKDGCQVEEPITDSLTGNQIGVKLKNHPAVAVSNTCWRNVHMFCSELGLSLVARQRLSVEAGDTTNESDELMKLLSAPRPERPKYEPSVDDPESVN